MLPEERETIIRYDDKDGNAIIYTSNKRVYNKLRNEFEVSKIYRNDGQEVGYEFIIPKQYVRIKPPKSQAIYIGGH